jgi:hypothetical protein
MQQRELQHGGWRHIVQAQGELGQKGESHLQAIRQRGAALASFEPGRLFESGLAATVDWYLGNEPWWSALPQRS